MKTAKLNNGVEMPQMGYIDLMLLHQPFCDRYGAYVHGMAVRCVTVNLKK